MKKRRLAESARDVAALRATAADERARAAETAAAKAAKTESAALARARDALAAVRRVAQVVGDKLAQRELIRDATRDSDDELDPGVGLRRNALFSVPAEEPRDAEMSVTDALAETGATLAFDATGGGAHPSSATSPSSTRSPRRLTRRRHARRRPQARWRRRLGRTS